MMKGFGVVVVLHMVSVEERIVNILKKLKIGNQYNMSKTFFSEFSNEQHKDIAVGIITKDDERYETLKPLFDEYGHGFTDTKIGCIFIDGEAGLSEDELKVVEAHEVAHIRLKHKMGDRNMNQEVDADLFARAYLLQHGYEKAANLITKHSMFRHGNQI